MSQYIDATAIDKVVELTQPITHEINGEIYSTEPLQHIPKHVDRPRSISFSSLDGIAKAIITEISRVTLPLFVSVDGHDDISVFTTLRSDNQQRDTLYTARPDLMQNRLINTWRGHEQAIIALQSQFVENEGLQYLMGLLRRLSKDNNVSSADNGVTQEVTARQGVALAQTEAVRPRVTLRPYRTFLEVEQPESEFLVRVRDGDGLPEICLFEADGGRWKLDAKKNIAAYLANRLHALVKAGKVVITE